MAHDRIVWLVGTTDQDPDLSVRPLGFNPKGFLVAILPDAEEAERAAAALRAAGFADRKLRIFTSGQILDDHARYTGQKSLPAASSQLSPTTRNPSLSTRATPATAASPYGFTSSTTRRPTARSGASPAATRCTSGTTATADRATSTSSAPPPDPKPTPRAEGSDVHNAAQESERAACGERRVGVDAERATVSL
jgi:hypothetical protein